MNTITNDNSARQELQVPGKNEKYAYEELLHQKKSASNVARK
jgi:hypothetical protein